MLFDQIRIDTSNLSVLNVKGKRVDFTEDTVYLNNSSLMNTSNCKYLFLNKSVAIREPSEIMQGEEICFYDASNHPIKTCLYFQDGGLLYIKDEFYTELFSIFVYYFLFDAPE